MSILGRRTAIISLGCSCQVARQIKLYEPRLSELTGDSLKRSRFPFDWLISPLNGIEQVLNRPSAPGPDDVEFHPAVFKKAVFWKSRHVYFWHDFLVDGRVDIPAAFAENQEKYRHAFEKFARLGAWSRRIFVLANTQNNLDDVRARAPACDFSFSAARIARIAARLDAIFPDGRNELITVAYRSRITDNPADWPAEPYLLEPDLSDWEGDDAAWAQVFEAYFDRNREQESRPGTTGMVGERAL
ncbi:hypothetical protein SAMN02745194_02896 [Roseomonas rosea]|uniref:Papain-like cysteine peptidase n=1 Tax=Muricoccus roseus TaxID=198092 RepID=A0A1M6KGT2_9PROT|nr:hypothetical protein [Roseomonas rosea]SHJ58174.1 hypothetical protein SAMN02745194_02896 [Roseomonas rosea]